MPLKVIGTDGGLLPAAVSKGYVMLMPGERVDVWADFASLAGKQVILRSLSLRSHGHGGAWEERWYGRWRHGKGWYGYGGGRRWFGSAAAWDRALANGAAFNILTVNVGRKATVKPVLGPLPRSPALRRQQRLETSTPQSRSRWPCNR